MSDITTIIAAATITEPTWAELNCSECVSLTEIPASLSKYTNMEWVTDNPYIWSPSGMEV